MAGRGRHSTLPAWMTQSGGGGTVPGASQAPTSVAATFNPPPAASAPTFVPATNSAPMNNGAMMQMNQGFGAMNARAGSMPALGAPPFVAAPVQQQQQLQQFPLAVQGGAGGPGMPGSIAPISLAAAAAAAGIRSSGGLSSASVNPSAGPAAAAVTSAAAAATPSHGWTEHRAPDGKPYWYNAATKLSTYDKPDVLKTALERALKCEWAEHKNATTGKVYYYNSVTKESVWDEPHEYAQHKLKLQAAGLLPNANAAPAATATAGGCAAAGAATTTTTLGIAKTASTLLVTVPASSSAAGATPSGLPGQQQLQQLKPAGGVGGGAFPLPAGAMMPGSAMQPGMQMQMQQQMPMMMGGMGIGMPPMGGMSMGMGMGASAFPMPQGALAPASSSSSSFPLPPGALAAGGASAANTAFPLPPGAVGALPGSQQQVAQQSGPAASADGVPGAEGRKKKGDKDKQQPVINWETLTPAERVAAFKDMLREKEIREDARWGEVLPVIQGDRRFNALKTVGERKQVFSEYLASRAKEERETRRKRAAQAREDFIALLAQRKDVVRPGARFRDVEAALCKEPAWSGLPPNSSASTAAEPMLHSQDRIDLFEEYMQDAEKRARDEWRREMEEKERAFIDLLRSRPDIITTQAKWADVKAELSISPAYNALDKQDRLRVYRDYILGMERVEMEARAAEENKKKDAQRRVQDGFMALLRARIAIGKVTCRSKWEGFKAELTSTPDVPALPGSVDIASYQASASMPEQQRMKQLADALADFDFGPTVKEVFLMAVDEADKAYRADKRVIRDAVDDADIGITLLDSVTSPKMRYEEWLRDRALKAEEVLLQRRKGRGAASSSSSEESPVASLAIEAAEVAAQASKEGWPEALASSSSSSSSSLLSSRKGPISDLLNARPWNVLACYEELHQTAVEAAAAEEARLRRLKDKFLDLLSDHFYRSEHVDIDWQAARERIRGYGAYADAPSSLREQWFAEHMAGLKAKAEQRRKEREAKQQQEAEQLERKKKELEEEEERRRAADSLSAGYSDGTGSEAAAAPRQAPAAASSSSSSSSQPASSAVEEGEEGEEPDDVPAIPVAAAVMIASRVGVGSKRPRSEVEQEDGAEEGEEDGEEREEAVHVDRKADRASGSSSSSSRGRGARDASPRDDRWDGGRSRSRRSRSRSDDSSRDRRRSGRDRRGRSDSRGRSRSRSRGRSNDRDDDDDSHRRRHNHHRRSGHKRARHSRSRSRSADRSPRSRSPPPPPPGAPSAGDGPARDDRRSDSRGRW